MGGSGILPGGKDARRSRTRRSVSAPVRGSKKTLLTFNEKELKAVLLEEYDWQGPMVRDLLKRLQQRRKE